MELLVEVVSQVLASLKGDLVTSTALVMLLLGPGAVCCWFGYHLTGVRVAAGATKFTKFHARAQRVDRIDRRLASICNALSILTDSTETGLREAIKGLERLSGAEPTSPEAPRPEPQRDAQPVTGKAQTAREIAIAQGVSEGEVRLRMRLQETL